MKKRLFNCLVCLSATLIFSLSFNGSLIGFNLAKGDELGGMEVLEKRPPPSPSAPQYVSGQIIVKYTYKNQPFPTIQGSQILSEHERVVNEIVQAYGLVLQVQPGGTDFTPVHQNVIAQMQAQNKTEIEVRTQARDERLLKKGVLLREVQSKPAVNDYGLSRILVLYLHESEDVLEVVNRLSDPAPLADSDITIEGVYPNYIRELSSLPNDPRHSEQWGAYRIQAFDAWDLVDSRPEKFHGVIIAMLDTGIDYNHVDLRDNIWSNINEIPNNGIDDDMNGYTDDKIGYDFVANDNDPMDQGYHGTHTAGIAAGVTNNAIGIAGTAPSAKLMALRVCFKRQCSDTAIESALLYAIDNGADVVSMSIGGSNPGVIGNEIQMAHQEGLILVASAGNKSTSDVSYPAAFSEVIAVAASNYFNRKAGFSNYGDWVDVVAPGTDILSTTPANNYEKLDGTSMSCPFVSGVAALLKDMNPTLGPDEVRAALITGSRPVDIFSRHYFRPEVGIMDAENSLELFSPPGNVDPAIAFSGPTTTAEMQLLTTFISIDDANPGQGITIYTELDGRPLSDFGAEIVMTSLSTARPVTAEFRWQPGFDVVSARQVSRNFLLRVAAYDEYGARDIAEITIRVNHLNEVNLIKIDGSPDDNAVIYVTEETLESLTIEPNAGFVGDAITVEWISVPGALQWTLDADWDRGSLGNNYWETRTFDAVNLSYDLLWNPRSTLADPVSGIGGPFTVKLLATRSGGGETLLVRDIYVLHLNQPPDLQGSTTSIYIEPGPRTYPIKISATDYDANFSYDPAVNPAAASYKGITLAPGFPGTLSFDHASYAGYGGEPMLGHAVWWYNLSTNIAEEEMVAGVIARVTVRDEEGLVSMLTIRIRGKKSRGGKYDMGGDDLCTPWFPGCPTP